MKEGGFVLGIMREREKKTCLGEGKRCGEQRRSCGTAWAPDVTKGAQTERGSPQRVCLGFNYPRGAFRDRLFILMWKNHHNKGNPPRSSPEWGSGGRGVRLWGDLLESGLNWELWFVLRLNPRPSTEEVQRGCVAVSRMEEGARARRAAAHTAAQLLFLTAGNQLKRLYCGFLKKYS